MERGRFRPLTPREHPLNPTFTCSAYNAPKQAVSMRGGNLVMGA